MVIPCAVAFSALAVRAIGGNWAYTPDAVLAIAVDYRDTGHGTTHHPGAFCDDMPRVVGAGSPARCKQLDPGDNGRA